MTTPVTGVAAKKAAQLAKYQAVGSSRVPRGTRRARKAAAASAASAAPVTPPAPAAPEKTPSPAKTAPAAKAQPRQPLPKIDVPQPVSAGAGFVLALMFWTWVALPYLNNGGVAGVRAQLKAKFTNKAPDGSWLP